MIKVLFVLCIALYCGESVPTDLILKNQVEKLEEVLNNTIEDLDDYINQTDTELTRINNEVESHEGTLNDILRIQNDHKTEYEGLLMMNEDQNKKVAEQEKAINAQGATQSTTRKDLLKKLAEQEQVINAHGVMQRDLLMKLAEQEKVINSQNATQNIARKDLNFLMKMFEGRPFIEGTPFAAAASSTTNRDDDKYSAKYAIDALGDNHRLYAETKAQKNPWIQAWLTDTFDIVNIQIKGYSYGTNPRMVFTVYTVSEDGTEKECGNYRSGGSFWYTYNLGCGSGHRGNAVKITAYASGYTRFLCVSDIKVDVIGIKN